MKEHRGYHAHVYFGSPEQRDHAIALREEIPVRWPTAALGRVHDQPVAFHPRPMYQVSFSRDDFGTFVPWLMQRHETLSILIHPITGNVWQEHVDQPLWLGAQLPLDLDILRRFARRDQTVASPNGEPNVSIQ